MAKLCRSRGYDTKNGSIRPYKSRELNMRKNGLTDEQMSQLSKLPIKRHLRNILQMVYIPLLKMDLFWLLFVFTILILSFQLYLSLWIWASLWCIAVPKNMFICSRVIKKFTQFSIRMSWHNVDSLSAVANSFFSTLPK